MKKLLSIIPFIISISATAQTGKYDNNTSVQIYFSEGNFEVVNMNQCPSMLQIAFLGDTVTHWANGNGHRYKFQSPAKNFILSARNLTMCLYTDDTTWITVDSQIRAERIKSITKSKFGNCNTTKQ